LALRHNRHDKSSGLLKAIVERIKTYPKDKGVIIFTYKPRNSDDHARKGSHAECLKKALRAEGIDTEAELSTGKPRFVWLTWGQELGLSDFAYCEHVLLCGIYRKGHDQYACDIVGQLEDLTAEDAGDSKALRRVELSEIFHALYQAMGRGSCRITVDGQAKPMQLDWVGLEEFPEDYWKDAAPGLQRGFWESRHISKTKTVLANAEKIRKYLMGVPQSIRKVSSRTLKADAGLGGLHRNTFRQAGKKAMAQGIPGWFYSSDGKRGFFREDSLV